MRMLRGDHPGGTAGVRGYRKLVPIEVFIRETEGEIKLWEECH